VKGLKEKMEDFERGIIQAALEAAGGHQRRAAESLGVLPTTLCEKMKRLGLRDRTDTA
jgi:DNA-binding NtrC family response regulator